MELFKEEIYQPAHGFKLLDAVAVKNGQWELAIAENNKENLAQGVVVEFTENRFEIGYFGPIENLPVNAGAGKTLYLSPTTPGGLTTEIPTGVDQFIQPLIEIIDEDNAMIIDAENFSLTEAGKEYVDSVASEIVYNVVIDEVLTNNQSALSKKAIELYPNEIKTLRRML